MSAEGSVPPPAAAAAKTAQKAVEQETTPAVKPVENVVKPLPEAPAAVDAPKPVPAQVVTPEPTKEALTPTPEATKPTSEAPKPAVEASKPNGVVDAPKPTLETPKSVSEAPRAPVVETSSVAKPATLAPKPIADPTLEKVDAKPPSVEPKPLTEATQPTAKAPELTPKITKPTVVSPEPIATEPPKPTATEPTKSKSEAPKPTVVAPVTTEVTEPSSEKPKFTATPKLTPEPTDEAPKPVTSEAPKPTIEETKPTSAVTKPATEAPEPSIEATKPTSAVTKPVTEASKPTIKATKPETKEAKPATELTKPTTEAPKPTVEATKPASEAIKPTTEATKPATEAPKPTIEATKPVTEAKKQVVGKNLVSEASKPAAVAPKAAEPIKATDSVDETKKGEKEDIAQDAKSLASTLPSLSVRVTNVNSAKVAEKLEEAKKSASKDDEESDDDDDDDEDDDEDDDDDSDEDESEEEEAAPVPTPAKRTPKTPPGRKIMKVRPPGSVRVATPDVTASSKKRGRPSKADMAEREEERQAAIARGEPDPELKRKRRKPNKLMEAASEEEEEKKPKGKRKKKQEESEEEEEPVKKKKGRAKKVLTEEEKEEREAERKRKYYAAKEAAKAKKEKREAYLIMKRDEKKAKKAEEKIKREEHEKRMNELRAQYLDDNATDGSGPGTPGDLLLFDENSQSSLGSTTASTVKRKKAWGDVGVQEMSGIHNPLAHVTPETLFEYKWPLEGRNSEHYFLQEQVTEYIQVKSFKRKYPDCPRRLVEAAERDFLMEMRIVNETQADLGLTAIPSSSVLDIMCQDFYEKYDNYMRVLNERKERNLRNTNYSSGGGDVKVEEAAKLAAEYNRQLNQERREQRNSYFDIQTFTVHKPKTGKGRMAVLQKPKLGNYPVALIPGQFVDSYKAYNSKELNYFPLNTVMTAPPKPGTTLKDLALGSDGSESDSSSGGSSSGSSSGSESESEAEADEKVTRSGRRLRNPSPKKEEKKAEEIVEPKKEEKPRSLVDEIRHNAICKMCQGNMAKNKQGVPELLIHCSKCSQSCHPSCVGLHLDLLEYVTNYKWECTDCKKCMKCNNPADEDKMLFCDLCDRGYHIYCVGLEEVPKGRWHCSTCAVCISCNTTEPVKEEGRVSLWVHETKLNLKGEKIFSHTMCIHCHKTWKKGLYCPECNGVFGKDKRPLSSCWVCARQYHTSCVGLDNPNQRFICMGCQRKVQERTVARTSLGPGSRGGETTPARKDFYAREFTKTPTTTSFSRSGRRVTQINFANQF